MTTVGAYEAKTHLPRLLEQVEGGQVVTITKHGRAVARLVPAGPAPTTAAEAIAELRRARSGVRRGRVSVRRMIDEGRR
jgi:prevent-host-death family protein